MRSLIAGAVLAAVSINAQACGDSPHSEGMLTFDGAIQLDVSVVGLANFHTCDAFHSVAGQRLLSAHVAINAGNGQTFTQDYIYTSPILAAPIAHFTQPVAYAPGSYLASADGFVTFGFDSIDTRIDFLTNVETTVITPRTADMYFYGATTQVIAVPEPETYALILVGLGLIAWRKRNG